MTTNTVEDAIDVRSGAADSTIKTNGFHIILLHWDWKMRTRAAFE